MTRISRSGRALCIGALLSLFAVASACHGIADIPDVEYSAYCASYCDKLEKDCPAALSVYETRRECTEACAILDANANFSRIDSGNTMGCRTEQVNQARDLNLLEEKAPACAAAGPGGGTACTQHVDSPDCEGYCTLYTRACEGTFQRSSGVTKGDMVGDEVDCVAKCAAVNPMPDVYSWRKGQMSGDTLGCRLYYATSALVDPDTYCERAGLRAVGPCQEAPNCESFCRAVGVACPGALKVYDSDEQCLAVCANTPQGTKMDTGKQDTVGCRIAHVFNALLVNPEAHCPHIGPTGSNVCGDMVSGNCEAYCRLALAACHDEYQSAFGDDQTCIDTCLNSIDGADKKVYSVETASSGNTVQCRAHAAAVALTLPVAKRDCKAVFGGAPCE